MFTRMTGCFRNTSEGLVFAGIMLVGIFMLVLGLYKLDATFTLLTTGLTADGWITERWIVRGDDSDSYYVSYRFDAGFNDPSDWYTSSQLIDSRNYNVLDIESRVQVYFNANDPNENGIFLIDRMTTEILPLVFGVLFIAGGLLWLIWQVFTKLFRRSGV